MKRSKSLKKTIIIQDQKKSLSLIKNISSGKVKATLGGCLFFKEEDQLCLKKEKK